MGGCPAMRRHRSTLIASAVATSALLLGGAACGSSSSATSSDHGGLTGSAASTSRAASQLTACIRTWNDGTTEVGGAVRVIASKDSWYWAVTGGHPTVRVAYDAPNISCLVSV